MRTTVVAPGAAYATAEIPYTDRRLELVPSEGADAVVLRGRPLVETVVAPAVVALPIRRGQELGEVRIEEAGRIIARRPLVAAEDVREASLGAKADWYAGQALDEAQSMVSGVFGAIL